MTSLIGALLNRSAVPYAPPYRVLPAYGTRGAASSLGAMENVGTVFAIVNRTAEAAAAVDWKLYRKRTDGRRTYAYDGMDDRTEVTQHLALKVFNKPNAFFTRQELIEVYAQHMCLTGEAWWTLAYDGRMTVPTEIWPVRPDRMAIAEHPTEFISGYEYRSPDGQRIPLDLGEVIFSRRPDPLSPYRGVGPVQSIMAKARSVQYSDEWNLNYFLNSAEPGGFLKVNQELSDREIQRLQTRWTEAHRGASNAHRVAILDAEEMDWVSNSNTQRDMQFTELQTLNAEKIREAFAFPKFMLGTTEDANRASADAALVQFGRQVLVPLLERIKQALNNDFLPLFGTAGESVEFDFCDPIPENREEDSAELTAKVNAVVALVAAGADAATACEVVGLPPIEFKKAAPIVVAPAPPNGGDPHAPTAEPAAA